MGQRANSGGRRASLDDKKTRAAGRESQTVRGQIRDRTDEQFARGKTGGASGPGLRAAGAEVGRSSRPARKRGG